MVDQSSKFLALNSAFPIFRGDICLSGIDVVRSSISVMVDMV